MDPATLLFLSSFLLGLVFCILCLLDRDQECGPKTIPTVGGSSLPLLSYAGAFRHVFYAADILHEGYRRYKGGTFKFADFRRWYIIVCEPHLIEEIIKAPDDQLSFDEAVHEILQTDYTLGYALHHNLYHVPIVRSQLTRNIAKFFPLLHDELVASFHDEIPLNGSGWNKVRAMDAMVQVICRTSNRVFVGLPLCRNLDYCNLNKQFTVDVMKGGTIISLFPGLLKPFAARFLTDVPNSIKRGVKHLEPLISERLRMEQELGSEWTDKPNDMLQWLLDAAEGEERTVRALVLRILTINVGAIHTSAMCLTHAVYYLAAYPQYVQALREEVEAVVQQEGWTKAAMGKMHKLDSFFKEVQRLNGIVARGLDRKAMKDFRFSDGTFVPAGTYIAAPAVAMHHDEDVYPDAHTFNPWRFSDSCNERDDFQRQHTITTSPYFLLFGHGKHACPGRFFAVNELKAMLAHMVVSYDMKMDQEGEVPASKWIANALIPHPTAEVEFRRRVD
ncbi:cytochrome P450 [Laetiporus sulphureus 93-53]|uniref:Cytochrome P450 n=1 Tax=Laetiporus sulphureus 93-53 TaxID=1314785 RepID=A0A165BS43_9APHY|nr:cytochrome P450 [Laetiporus sulphureus 93-53]KZT01552.1 cytochrome P450 [Laetiporus sulphureus 93-53]